MSCMTLYVDSISWFWVSRSPIISAMLPRSISRMDSASRSRFMMLACSARNLSSRSSMRRNMIPNRRCICGLPESSVLRKVVPPPVFRDCTRVVVRPWAAAYAPPEVQNDMTAMSGPGRNSAAALKLPDRYGECPNRYAAPPKPCRIYPPETDPNGACAARLGRLRIESSQSRL